MGFLDIATRTCRMCGCTETKACTGKGANCHWVGDDLCSYCGDDIDEQCGLSDEDDTEAFECPAYYIAGSLFCPIAGTEECDWECKS